MAKFHAQIWQFLNIGLHLVFKIRPDFVEAGCQNLSDTDIDLQGQMQ